MALTVTSEVPVACQKAKFTTSVTHYISVTQTEVSIDPTV